MTATGRRSGIARRSQGGQAHGFNPLSPGNLIMWLDASMGITLNGSNVSAWADQSGNGNDVTQTDPAKQPPYTASDANFGGKGSLSTASGNYLITPGVMATQTALTIYAVFKQTTAAATRRLFYIGVAGTDDGAVGMLCNGAGQLSTTYSHTSALASTHLVTGMGTAVPYRVCSTIDVPAGGASVSAYLNNVLSGSARGTNSIAGGTTANKQWSVGASNTGTNSFTASIAAFLVYGALHDSTTRTNMDNYFKARFGL